MSRRPGGLVSDKRLPPKLRVVASDGVPAQSMHSHVSIDEPAKPEDLPERVSTLWDQVVNELSDAGLSSAVDGPALELALRHYAVAVAASDEVLRDGPTLFDAKNDRRMKHPASTVAAQHSAAFLEYAKQLGLTFVSRARVSTAKEADHAGNPFAVNG